MLLFVWQCRRGSGPGRQVRPMTSGDNLRLSTRAVMQMGVYMRRTASPSTRLRPDTPRMLTMPVPPGTITVLRPALVAARLILSMRADPR